MKNIKVGNIVTRQGFISGRYEVIDINRDVVFLKYINVIGDRLETDDKTITECISRIKKARAKTSRLSNEQLSNLILKRNYKQEAK